ncbi:SDR family NAD(P)-dependent oxidoreductase [Nonomuraea sp. NPDC050394]|uniref:SDR family NAD(P)-dependent oxidoreductase n=1 Tax=Nonomuraea sp. NPDC050394 TaxID=3364363 RepID=UPI0037AB8471
MRQDDRPTALVTGASTGIGEAFARELARRGHHLVVVARGAGPLDALAAEMKDAFGTVTEVLPADLTDHTQAAAVEERLADAARPVDVLVNSAGALTSGLFAKLPIAGEVSQVELNAVAPIRLTHSVLPVMLDRGRGAVLNVSSIAGEAPTPFGATYGASYSFLTAFGQALHMEVRRYGVRVTTLLPGFTAATADPSRRIQAADQVAREGLAALAAGRAVCVPGLRNKTSAAFARLAPRRLVRAVMEASRTS